MSQGAVAIFGDLNVASLNSIRSFVNNHNIPFFSWSYPSYENEEIQFTDLKSKEESSDIEGLNNVLENVAGGLETSNLEANNQKNIPLSTDYRNYLINMHPTISPLLIKLIKNFRWKTVYYLYNHDEGLVKTLTLFL